MTKVLIIDDELQIRTLLSRIIALEGYEVSQADSCKAAIRQIVIQRPDVVLCDVRLPDGNGVELIQRLKSASPDCEIVMLTAHGNISDGVQAIKNGAFDYITKGDDNNRIIPLLAQATEQAELNALAHQPVVNEDKQLCFDTILGRSKLMIEAIDMARKVAVTNTSILLTGETGTGKEVFANAIHTASSRHDNAFVAINCSALGKELLESEMFGHKSGAFTGAVKDKKGLFEIANQGTIFLDEVGEMPLDLQAKLLRVLESGEFIKVGDTVTTHVNVRVIAATNRNLRDRINEGQFREDLYYRLSVFNIELPPLRVRPEDIELYAKKFITTFSHKMIKPILQTDEQFFELLKRHPWRGNVRELRNVIERSIILCSDGRLNVSDLPYDIQTRASNTALNEMELANIERLHITKILNYTGGNKSETARLLKIGLTTLYRKIEEYKITI